MSRPRGNGVQRRLVAAARQVLEADGARCKVDFGRSGGHQVLVATWPDGTEHRFEIAGTPRSEHNSREQLVQRCRRAIRRRSC